MAFNEELANRVRRRLSEQNPVEEKKMMGGLTFMVNGKMCVGVYNDDLMARIDPSVYDDALGRRGSREMDLTGRPMRGFVLVGPEGVKADQDLDYWIGLALDFNKRAKASRKRQ